MLQKRGFFLAQFLILFLFHPSISNHESKTFVQRSGLRQGGDLAMPQLHQAGHCRLVLLLADLFQGQLGMTNRGIMQSFMGENRTNPHYFADNP